MWLGGGGGPFLDRGERGGRAGEADRSGCRRRYEQLTYPDPRPGLKIPEFWEKIMVPPE